MSHWCQDLHTLRSEERGRKRGEQEGREKRAERRGEREERGKGEGRGEGGGRRATTINGNFSLEKKVERKKMYIYRILDKGEGRGKRRAIDGNFSLIKEKLHMHLAHTN